jgi:AcrR family transcriptional regulator
MVPPDDARTGDPRTRAAQTKRDRTRGALLAAADAAFGTRGWARTRMEDIAAAAGVSAATAYNHFPTKHALIGHVYRPLILPLRVQAERALAEGRSVTEALIEQVHALVRTSWRHRMLTGALFAAVQEYTAKVGAPPRADDDLDPRTLAPVPEAICILVEYGQRTGELRSFPSPEDLSAMVTNLLLIRGANSPEEPPEVTSELLLTLMFGALRPELLLDDDGGDRPFRTGCPLPMAGNAPKRRR